MGYLFDTNIFIRSKNELPVDVWPTFWARIAELMHNGQISSSIKVKEEIDIGRDELTQWMKCNITEEFYLSLDAEILQKYAQLQNWVSSRDFYTPAAKEEFAKVADAYLIATAAAKNMTIVTYEVSNPNSKKRIMIPDVCNAFDVKYCDLNTVFRNLGVTI